MKYPVNVIEGAQSSRYLMAARFERAPAHLVLRGVAVDIASVSGSPAEFVR